LRNPTVQLLLAPDAEDGSARVNAVFGAAEVEFAL
jgi:hypothetical protein